MAKTPEYRRLSDVDLLKVSAELHEEIDDFITYGLGCPPDMEYTVCGLDIIDAIIRVDKRQFYFRLFHGMDINEAKKAALFAYWFVKLRPIKVTSKQHVNKIGYNDRINELFAVHHLLEALCGCGKLEFWDGQKGVNIDAGHPYIEELRYSFRFRNFTIDSMIVLADAITTGTFLSDRPLHSQLTQGC